MSDSRIGVQSSTFGGILLSGQERPFVIPEYQRPYSWEKKHIEKLFNDIWDFALGNECDSQDYFLGSIITQNDPKEQQVIDGQQRITSLILLLRAIYAELEGIKNEAESKGAKVDEKVENFLNRIGRALWKENPLSGKLDKSSHLLSSRVVYGDDKEAFQKIMIAGEAEPKAKDNYSKNYREFQKLLANTSKEFSLDNKCKFFHVILSQISLLAVSTSDQKSALRVFATLNNRGMPLSDADIFKATIYGNLKSQDERSKFIEKWDLLIDNIKGAYGESAKDIRYGLERVLSFHQYYLIAKNKNTHKPRMALREYYLYHGDAKGILVNAMESGGFVDELMEVSEFLCVVNRVEIEDASWTKNISILKSLDVLGGCYAVLLSPALVYYMFHHRKDGFEEKFEVFLNKLTKEIMTNDYDRCEAGALELNLEISKCEFPKFEGFKNHISNETISEIQDNYDDIDFFLKILAYERQDELLPPKFEIEHIFPRAYAKSYHVSHDKEFVEEQIERLGNKLLLEKKLNIQASNDYYTIKKQPAYLKSKITMTKEFAEKYDDWSLEAIDKRGKEMAKELVEIFKRWDDEYQKAYDKANQA